MTRVLIQRKRSIVPSRNSPNNRLEQGDGVSQAVSPIFIEATVRETHAAQAQITTHPVEEGLDVADYIRSEPKAISIDAAFSNQPFCDQYFDEFNDGIFAGTDQTRVQAAWEAFLNLIDGVPRRETFTVTTGLRVYDNMALQSVGTSQDVNNPDAIVISCTFIEVRTVRSAFTTVPARRIQDGETQQRGSGDVNQGEQHAQDVLDCNYCPELCNRCLTDNPAAFTDETAPEYIYDPNCVQALDDEFGVDIFAGNVQRSEAFQAKVCERLAGDATAAIPSRPEIYIDGGLGPAISVSQ